MELRQKISSNDSDRTDWLVARAGRLVDRVMDIELGDHPYLQQLEKSRRGKIASVLYRSEDPFSLYHRVPSLDLKSHWKRVWSNEQTSEPEIVI